jgi:hypothetical protein
LRQSNNWRKTNNGGHFLHVGCCGRLAQPKLRQSVNWRKPNNDGDSTLRQFHR